MKPASGVYTTTKKDGTTYYRSSITFRNKHISLGSFSSHGSAHRAYLDAQHILSSPCRQVEDYDAASISLPFEKWVSLINYRDNNLYIKTPIYLKQRYFFYYYSVDLCLKFDIDDLFFYSNHKIMKRGGHLFLTEYGMQTSLLSRYGIRSFAVAGRDYCFVNGDPADFRYGNIKILNPYHGVAVTLNNGRPLYTAKIHVTGDILVGRYPSESEAAVAYNKAAHILHMKGVEKAFPVNYIPDLDEKAYKDLYNKVRIAKKILFF